MQNFDIVKTSCPKKTFRVASVMGQFDIQTEQVTERFTGAIDLDGNWNIGAIVGASGTGKSSIAQSIFGDIIDNSFVYGDNSVLDDMPQDCSVKDITNTFSECGFSSSTSWLKPYSVLSNGEKMRVDIARALLQNKDVTVFDEFTSVIDRKVAQIGSYAIQKNVRKRDKKFVAVTCHYDVLDWLCPDWLFDTNSMTFSKMSKKKDQTLSLKYAKGLQNIGDTLSVTII